MLDNVSLRAVLDSLVEPVVFVDNHHIIRYVNPVAKKQYEERGFKDLVGKSLMHCHNEESQEKIKRIHDQLTVGSHEELVSVNDEGQRIFARAVRDEGGQLLGYYERYERPTQS
ncbi:MAG: PAS domain-containing protein [Candidatus Latescibacterota bacterium]|nr:MAG: PAS domain-containing protein [Candidatus Latescibacterota bacterium]